MSHGYASQSDQTPCVARIERIPATRSIAVLANRF
jgi:hypothetical protein